MWHDNRLKKLEMFLKIISFQLTRLQPLKNDKNAAVYEVGTINLLLMISSLSWNLSFLTTILFSTTAFINMSAAVLWVALSVLLLQISA